MNNQAEPTVEEILASIKQVIARDNRAIAAETRRERETRGMPAIHDDEDEDDDILDLASAGDFLDDMEDDAPEAQSAGAPLVDEATQASMRESLAALSMLAQPGARPQIVRSGETSVESLMRELLRPALAEWLDANLPALVERMVADEIRRITGGRG